MSENAKSRIECNYPSLNRKDLMSHQPLNSNDFPVKQINKLHTNRNWSVNLYNLDIEGSSPREFGSFNQKIDYTNKNDDIERSSPKKLHIKLNKPEYNLSNENIDFSSPNCLKIKTTRHLNPLEPKYSLPVSTNLTVDPPRFIRDNIQISDIEGSCPKKIMSRWFQRETFNKSDIPNSFPKIPYKRRTFHDSLNYKDVTHCEFKTKRSTNPLEPVYHLEYPTGEKVSVGSIDGNRPVVFSKYNIPDPMNLKLDDIAGSNPGSKNKIHRFTGMNYMYSTSDIFKAQADSLKKGISTKRNVNPLVPNYQFLGHEELKDGGDYNPYGKKIPTTSSYTNIKEVNKLKDAENTCLNKITVNKTIKDDKAQEVKDKEKDEDKQKVVSPKKEEEKIEDFSSLPIVQDK